MPMKLLWNWVFSVIESRCVSALLALPYCRNRIVGEDVAWRKTRREEHTEQRPAQTHWHDSGSAPPRGPCHWPKHSGLRGSRGARVSPPLRSADPEARAGRCGAEVLSRCEPINANLTELDLFTAHTSTMQTGRLMRFRVSQLQLYLRLQRLVCMFLLLTYYIYSFNTYVADKLGYSFMLQLILIYLFQRRPLV